MAIKCALICCGSPAAGFVLVAFKYWHWITENKGSMRKVPSVRGKVWAHGHILPRKVIKR